MISEKDNIIDQLSPAAETLSNNNENNLEKYNHLQYKK